MHFWSIWWYKFSNFFHSAPTMVVPSWTQCMYWSAQKNPWQDTEIFFEIFLLTALGHAVSYYSSTQTNVITESFPYCGTENKNNLMLYWHDNTQSYPHLNKTHEVLKLYHQLVDNWYYWILNYYNLSTAQMSWSQKQWIFILPFI